MNVVGYRLLLITLSGVTAAISGHFPEVHQSLLVQGAARRLDLTMGCFPPALNSILGADRGHD